MHMYLPINFLLCNLSIPFSDSNNQRLMLGDSSMIPVPGSKGPLKPQGTINSMKQLRIDTKK